METNYQDIALIVESIQMGDTSRFTDLYDLSYTPLYALCFSILKNEHDAQDAVHDTFQKIYTHIDRLEHPPQYVAWSRRIATNASLALIRQNNDIPTADITEMISKEAPPIRDNLDHILDMERESSLLDLLGDLDSQTRDIMLMKYYQGYKIKEIESILGIKAATIKTRIHRTKKLLRKQIEAQRGKTFALPVALVPTAYIFNECISGEAATSGIIRGPEVLRYTWGHSSAVAKVTFIAGATGIALGSTIVGSHMTSNNLRQTISSPTSDIIVVDVDILSYEEHTIEIAVAPTDMPIDYTSIFATIGTNILYPHRINSSTGVLTFHTDASYMILQISDTGGNVSSYGLEMNYE